MKVFLLTGAQRVHCRLPHANADYVIADGRCHGCGAESFGVRGGCQRPSEDDQAWEADAVSICCRQRVGTLRVEVSTLFGVREDEAVLNGRCRVCS